MFQNSWSSRREFLSVCSALGLACGLGQKSLKSGFDGSVIVVGAGVAGMSVGHLLAQKGIDFSILEAAPTYGGRVKTAKDFVDFPIALGGEWLHVNEKILPKIVNDDSKEISQRVVSYEEDLTYGYYDGDELSQDSIDAEDEDITDKKFVGGTWLTFFESHILPGIKKQMQFKTQIVSIDYSDSRVKLLSADGQPFKADVVVVTVPPQVIKDGDVSFVPALPKRKRKAFDDAFIWGGMKVFVHFKEKFYPTFLDIAGSNTRRGEKMFYDAAYGQKTKANVLGLFTVGDQSKPYQSRQGNELREYLLAELDEIFDGKASPAYIKHIAQDWNKEEFIRQAYYASGASWRLPPRMQKSIDGKLFFAGDTYTNGEDWGSAHAAALSARAAVDELLS